MTAFYNENNKEAAATLRELIKQGHIAPGVVDERSIVDIKPVELRGFIQCHFFAGEGIWSLALRNAGWPDHRPVWTGSCPCQPFSAAGKGDGFADERHLWPAWEWLIARGKPRGVPVYGEQVASKDGLAWLDLVHADMEGQGNTVGALDLCAAGFGAPHIRQRLFFVANASNGRQQHEPSLAGSHAARAGTPEQRKKSGSDIGIIRMADLQQPGLEGFAGHGDGGREPGRIDSESIRSTAAQGSFVGMGNTVISACERDTREFPETQATVCGERLINGNSLIGLEYAGASLGERPGPTNGHWRDADWLLCRDGRWRPVEPGTFPLAHGAPCRVGRLRLHGNGIVEAVARNFIEITEESRIYG